MTQDNFLDSFVYLSSFFLVLHGVYSFFFSKKKKRSKSGFFNACDIVYITASLSHLYKTNK